MKDLSYCGLSCSQCPVYIATIKNDDKLREKLSKEYSTESCIFTVEDMSCQGCHSSMVENTKMCGQCEIRICASSKDIDTCGECSEYPCNTISKYVPWDSPNRKKLDKINKKKL